MTEQNTKTVSTFSLEKIYIKDSSFEAPNSPQVFLDAATPQVNVQLRISHGPLNHVPDLYEVVLAVTASAKSADKTVFLAEVQQAGLFRVAAMPAPDLLQILEIACPNVLLPFARQVVNSLIESGGFPQLLVSPINFEALYLQKQSAPPQVVAH